jgi:hypothetical protein
VIFFFVVSFSMQMTDLWVGPGHITASGSTYSLSPSRIQDFEKTKLVSEVDKITSYSNAVILCDGRLEGSWVSSTGRFEVPGHFDPFLYSTGTLASPTSIRTAFEASGATFGSGYTVFFLGNDSLILGILRVGWSDTTTHRIYSVSMAVGNTLPNDLMYDFAEKLEYAQTQPAYSVQNAISSSTPFYSITLPDPSDTYAVRAERLDGTLNITRNGKIGLMLNLPAYP